jgi:hypothetical protein
MVSGAWVSGGSARSGLARLRWVWRAPVRVWRCQFRHGALASSRRCFSTSSIRTPSSPPSPRSQLSLTCYLHAPTHPPLFAAFPAPAPGLHLLGLRLRLTSLLPPSLPTEPTNVRRSEYASSTMAVPLHPAATARIPAPTEPTRDAVSRARIDVSNPLSP